MPRYPHPPASAASATEIGQLSASVDLLRRAFHADLADGRIGKRHNTYQHRARMLRQQTAALDAMQAAAGATGRGASFALWVHDDSRTGQPIL